MDAALKTNRTRFTVRRLMVVLRERLALFISGERE